MALAPRRIDLPDVRKITRSSVSRQVVALFAVLVDAGLAEVTSVGKVVERIRGPGAFADGHRLAPVNVAGLAGAEFFARLMRVARIALRMSWESSLQ